MIYLKKNLVYTNVELSTYILFYKFQKGMLMKHTSYIESWLYDLDLTSRVTHEVLKNFFISNDFPISMDEYIIMDTLINNPDIPQLKLSKLILKGRAHTGRFLIALEKKGFVDRIPSKNGQRLVMKSAVTEKGKQVHKIIEKRINELVDECSVDLNDEVIDKLQNILKKIKTLTAQKYNVKFD